MLITQALASSGAVPEPSLLSSLMPIILIVAIMYFLLYRPQMKRAKEHKNFVSNLKRRDKVIVGGSIVGEISKLEDKTAILKIAEGVEITILREAVSGSYQNDSKTNQPASEDVATKSAAKKAKPKAKTAKKN